MNVIPFLSQIAKYHNILISGCGGGFDIYGAVPIYFLLQSMNIKVTLASYSFSEIHAIVNTQAFGPDCVIVTKTSEYPYENDYAPEVCLSRWFWEEKQIDVSIYTIDKVGPKRAIEVYQAIQTTEKFDAVILIDGGTDSLLQGNEFGLGTYGEDLISIVAVHALPNVAKYLLSIGFGVDDYHGVLHYDVLNSIACLAQDHAFLGSWSLVLEQSETQDYVAAVVYANKHHRQQSIVHNSIVSAIQGHFENYHVISRTHGTELFINPLMSIIWAFNVDGIYRHLLFTDQLKDMEDFGQVIAFLNTERNKLQLRPKKKIPL